ncbi:MAG: class I SAM-dependent methyltransferase [Clostridiales bacterium]|nr:class I SAM-dependent methyltransferase [Clostridiales bacterium]
MKKSVVLSKRMETVVNMVSPQSLIIPKKKCIADIGCDHAYVSIALVERGFASKVIAMDVRKGPLDIAAKNVTEYGMDDRIELRLSDGMEKLEPGEADAIIIAGMGGLLMCSILKKGIGDTYRPILVLQPQSDIREVRKFLLEQGYILEREQMLVEEGKYYTVLRSVPIETMSEKECDALFEETKKNYSETELIYGRYGLEHRDTVLHEYLQKEAEVLNKIEGKLVETVQNASGDRRKVPEKTLERLDSVRKERKQNKEALDYFQA